MPEEVHDIWITDQSGSHWALQIMVYDDDGDTVIFRRNPAITWSKSAHTICLGDVRILNPLVTFLFKATNSSLEDKDIQDIKSLIEGLASVMTGKEGAVGASPSQVDQQKTNKKPIDSQV